MDIIPQNNGNSEKEVDWWSSRPLSRGFGGKSRVAAAIWARFGNVPSYVDPFFGSGAVLFARPDQPQAGWEPPRTTVGKLPARSQRLKALGNAVVPAQAYPVFAAIAAILGERAVAEGAVSA